MPRASRPGWGRTATAGEPSRPAFDLGKPRFILRERFTRQDDGNEGWAETWVSCPRCLARKEEGKLAGGYLWTYRDVPTKATASGIYRRRRDLVPCTCKLGQERRRRWSSELYREIDDASSYHPDKLLGPPQAEAAADPSKEYVEIIGPLGQPDEPQQLELADDEALTPDQT